MTSSFKDLFSAQSNQYARYRPAYPAQLFTFLAQASPGHGLAWDCATGNGQAAISLARHFNRIVATDISWEQISKAPSLAPIEYRVAPAENSGLADTSVDCITVAQAFHWFRQAEFFAEVRRTLRPGGICAIWCYGLCQITPEVDAIILRLYRETLGPYWEEERVLVEEGYASVSLPFQYLQVPSFAMTAEWSLSHLIGYLATWSALQSCIKRTGSDPLVEIAPLLKKTWGSESTRTVSWALSVKACKNS